MKKGVALFLFLLIGVSLVCAANNEANHMKLLAVQELDGEYKGSEADLFLELNDGSGRVFLETFPLTKIDTQVSTRFAKEIACSYFNLNCKKDDFIFTIKSGANIIGGPSAGGAIAVLATVSLLEIDYDEKVAITGTINSGGIIGPVGGVKEKLEAAAENSLEKVLIAKGSSMQKVGNNTTFDLIEYGRENLSLEVIEVADLNEAVYYFTGKELKKNDVSIEVSESYQGIMQELMDVLCGRASDLIDNLELTVEESINLEDKQKKSKLAAEQEDYYSAASFCFGANIQAKELSYSKVDEDRLFVSLKVLEKKVSVLEENLKEKEMETISDLQTMMIVKERLNEVKEWIVKFSGEENKSYALAYAEERYFSALSWMSFFSMEGKELIFDEDVLRDSCLKKIAESEELYQYVDVLFGGYVDHVKKSVDGAKKSLQEEEYGLCLIKASQGKAEANAFMSSIGLGEETIKGFLESKMISVKKVMAENTAEGMFPILGYSYYQYANSLAEEDPRSALLYLDYALELSDLGIYFEEEKIFSFENSFDLNISNKEWIKLGEGVLIGLLLAWVIVLVRRLFKKK